MAFGLSSTGLSIPQMTDIRNEINQIFIAAFGANINTNDNGVFGTISGIFAEREYLLWAAIQDDYNSSYPDTAFGASLDNVGAISGIPRLGALPSTIQGIKLFGTAGTVIPGAAPPTVATQFAVNGSPNSIFQLDSDVTLIAGQNCIQTITFSAVPTAGTWHISRDGQETTSLAFNAVASVIQTAIRLLPFCSGCVVSGNYTSGFTITFAGAGTGGLMVQPQLLTPDSTLLNGMATILITPLVTQAGIDQGTGNLIATVSGPVVANAGTLTVIVTPVSGLTNVANITDAVLGRNVETDNEYRARRAETLQIAGAGTVEAIRSRLLALTGVTAVIVFENETLIPDMDGRPPKSFEAVVQGGDQQAIADLLWQVKPAGILTDGSIETDITDSQGQTHEIRFSRPTPVPIYVILNLSVNINYPSNGDLGAVEAIVASGNALGIGKEVVTIPYLISSIAPIQGIEDAQLLIGTSPNPTSSDNIPMAPNQVPLFDSSRVQVNHV